MKLEERDDEVHHGLDASGRNMIVNRATYTCTIITITIIITITMTIITPLTDETEFLLHVSLPSLRQDVLAWSCLSILWCFRSNSYVAALTYERNRRCPPGLIVCIVKSHIARPYQLPSLANGTEGFHGTDKTLDLAPHVLICHVFQ